MFISFMIVLALFTIFSDDIRLSSTTKSADPSFEAITSIIFFIFILEILMTCYYKEDYMTLPSLPIPNCSYPGRTLPAAPPTPAPTA